MSCPRPLFSIGEEVAIVTMNQPHMDTSKTEVTDCIWVREWSKGPVNFPACWGYVTAHDSSPGLFPERCLRKLPPEEGTSWPTCVWIPKELSDA